MGKLGADSFDAVAIIDADTIVAPDFLYAMDEALRSGAVAARAATWCVSPMPPQRRRFGMRRWQCRHHLRPLGRRRLGASCGLYGNGMVFARSAVEDRSWSGHLVEDAEFQMELLLDGHHVEYVPGAVVLAEMPATLDRAESQNRRWERGRIELAVRYVPLLLRRFVTGPDRLAVGDAVLDHLTPPISALVVAEAATALVGVGGAMLGSRTLARAHARGAVRSLGGRGARRGWPVVGRGTALELSTTTVGASSGSLEVRCVVVRVASGRTCRMGPDGTQRFGRAVVRPSTRSLLGVPIAHVTMEDTLAIVESMVREGRQRGTTSQIATVNVDFLVNALEDEHLAGILARRRLVPRRRHADRLGAGGSPNADPGAGRRIRSRAAPVRACGVVRLADPRARLVRRCCSDAPPASSPSGIRRRK